MNKNNITEQNDNMVLLQEYIDIISRLNQLEKDKQDILLSKNIKKLDLVCMKQEEIIPQVLSLEFEKNLFLESDINLTPQLKEKILEIDSIKRSLQKLYKVNTEILKDFKNLFDLYISNIHDKNNYTNSGEKFKNSSSLYNRRI